jgi:D-3-phosphoglycerate dehydrogenase
MRGDTASSGSGQRVMAMGWRVAVTSHHFNETATALERLYEAGCCLVETGYGGDRSDVSLGGDELIQLLHDVDAVISSAQLTRQVIAGSPRLKVISRRGVGYDNVDMPAATEHGVVVTVTSGALNDSVADHTFALMLCAARRVLACHRRVQHGDWRGVQGLDLWRKTLGIIGLGGIGRAVAARAAGFQMRVLAHDMVIDHDYGATAGVAYVPLEELLRQSDFVSLNVPLTEATWHLLGASELDLMKPTAVLVNTARGALIDEQALIKKLRDGSIWGAGLDTFEYEPPGVTELATLENVVLSPHVVSLLHGRPPHRNVVNRDVLGRVSWLAR